MVSPLMAKGWGNVLQKQNGTLERVPLSLIGGADKAVVPN